MGLTSDSGHNPCLDGTGKTATVTNESRGDLRGRLGRPPRLEIRADYGRFRNPKRSPQTTLASRDALLLSAPLFPQKISHHIVITGESCDSGFSPALDVMAKR